MDSRMSWIHATGSGKKAVELSKWKDAIRKHWSQISIKDVKVDAKPAGVFVGDKVHVEAVVHLGPVDPEFVTVQAYYGEALNNEIQRPAMTAFTRLKKVDDGNHLYTGEIPATDSGSYGLNVRVIPMHPNVTQDHELRLITWAK